jgi:hypothetical protein
MAPLLELRPIAVPSIICVKRASCRRVKRHVHRQAMVEQVQDQQRENHVEGRKSVEQLSVVSVTQIALCKYKQGVNCAGSNVRQQGHLTNLLYQSV